VPISTVSAAASSRVEVKKSVFLGKVAPAAGAAEADAVIAQVRKEHYSARHHCTAMILGPDGNVQRSNDDGEPSGSAGAPMLSVLRHHGLTDVVAVVTRYFGGTLLGVGGLIRAYTDAVTQALAQAALVHFIPAKLVLVELPFAVSGDLEHLLRAWAADRCAQVLDVSYEESAKLTLAVPLPELPAFRELTAAWPARGAATAELEDTVIRQTA
jgi:uncharacterized YigZ family protein